MIIQFINEPDELQFKFSLLCGNGRMDDIR